MKDVVTLVSQRELQWEFLHELSLAYEMYSALTPEAYCLILSYDLRLQNSKEGDCVDFGRKLYDLYI